MPLLTQIASGLCWVLYGSFFEWYWHKFWMHTPRFPREAFRGHTIVHHGLYKGDDSFFLSEGEHPEHILLKPYALPGIILAHAPIVLLIERFLVPHTAWGALIACITYFCVYEYMHWNMHVPRGHWVERFRWFQFLRTHHKLHHRYFQSNFCVLFPLADWCLGTLITEESLARRKAEREAAIASGTTLPLRKPHRRSRSKKERVSLAQIARAAPLAYRLIRLKERRVRRNRRIRKLPNVRELLQFSENRRNR
jgi:hypothetical protein